MKRRKGKTSSRPRDYGSSVPRNGDKTLRFGLSVALVAIFSLAPYLNSLRNGFAFDDNTIIVLNPVIRSLCNIPTILTTNYWYPKYETSDLYRPLVILSYALNYAVGKLDPFGYHLANVLLHLFASVLVYLVARKLSPNGAAALIAGLLFAAHPIHTEAVTGIVGRAELMSALFVLLAFWLYIERKGSAHRAPLYACSLASYLLGLLSKENAIVLLGILPLYDLLMRRELRAGALRVYFGYLVVTALYFLARYSALGALIRPEGYQIDPLDNPLCCVGAHERALTAAKVIGKYLKLLFVPIGLSPDYSFNQVPVSRSVADLAALTALALVCLILASAFKFARKGMAVEAFSLLFFFIALLPASNLVFPIGTIMAERLLYLPSFGFCLFLALAAARFFAMANLASFRLAQALAVGVVLFFYSYLAIKQNMLWKDDLTLFPYMVKVAPNSAKAHYFNASAHRANGEHLKAIDSLRQALRIKPDFLPARLSLGMTLAEMGRYDEALEELKSALRVNPGSHQVLSSIGVVYYNSGRMDEAVKYFQAALQVRPSDIAARLNLANAFLAKGEAAKAVEQYRKVIELDPENAQARSALGLVYLETGNTDQAINELERALRVDPNHALARELLSRAYSTRKGK